MACGLMPLSNISRKFKDCGDRLSIKMASHQYWDSHYKDKTVSRWKCSIKIWKKINLILIWEAVMTWKRCLHYRPLVWKSPVIGEFPFPKTNNADLFMLAWTSCWKKWSSCQWIETPLRPDDVTVWPHFCLWQVIISWINNSFVSLMTT